MEYGLTSDAVLAVRFMWTLAIRLLTSVYIPGTNVTPLSIIFFVASVTIGLKFLTRFFNVGSVDESVTMAAAYENNKYMNHVKNPSWKKK